MQYASKLVFMVCALTLTSVATEANASQVIRCKCTWATGWGGQGEDTFSPVPGDRDCSKTQKALEAGEYPGGGNDDPHGFKCTPIGPKRTTGVSIQTTEGSAQ